MFRVDPAFKILPVAALSQLIAEDYEFVQVTRNRPIWLLNAFSMDETRQRSCYLFVNLVQALEIATLPTWSRAILSVILPDDMSEEHRVTASVVTEVWECQTLRGRRECFEVTTERRKYVFNTAGASFQKAKRLTALWTAIPELGSPSNAYASTRLNAGAEEPKPADPCVETGGRRGKHL